MSERDDSVSIYIMCHEWSGGLSKPVKVGISANPWARLKSLQTGAPFKMALAASFWTPSRDIARALETGFHPEEAADYLDMSGVLAAEERLRTDAGVLLQ